jgi:hypothetical protein
LIYGVILFSGCTEDQVAEELFPPDNPFLAASAWAVTHRNSYCQASSPLPGPEASDDIRVDFIEASLPTITLAFGKTYPDGSQVAWGSIMTEVFKLSISATGMQRHATLAKQDVDMDSKVGAYTLLDNADTFLVPTRQGLVGYREETPGVMESPIYQVGKFALPADEAQGSIVGVNMTYDGWVAFVTSLGTVGVISRNLKEHRLLQLGQDEEVSNSLAVDEDGGIYIVTSKKMYRVQWTGEELSLDAQSGAWSADYEIGPEQVESWRLGVGSGATPSLMGVGSQDKFVVITDGQELMHLVLLWRDEIPSDWQAIAPGKDRRIAAEVPVTFGNPDITRTLSEQSVVVVGYSAAVVNNDYGTEDFPMSPVMLGIPAYGVERFDWNPKTRKLTSVWANPDLACPNGVPCMSTGSNLMYCVGKRQDTWTLEGIDWDTGQSAFSHPLGQEGIFNSVYAAAQVGPDNNLVSGTVGGVINVVAVAAD